VKESGASTVLQLLLLLSTVLMLARACRLLNSLAGTELT
jgi:hypothetical protein